MAAIQKGIECKISYGSLAYTGFVAQSAGLSFPNKNVEEIQNADGATQTKILMDPSQQLTAEFVILSTGSITPPIEGAIVTLTPPQGTSTAYYCESAEVSFTAGASRLSLTLRKEDSMDYTT